MSNEEEMSIARRSFEEDKENLAVEICTAKCPTCEQTCEYTAEHQGLHHCPAGHEWV